MTVERVGQSRRAWLCVFQARRGQYQAQAEAAGGRPYSEALLSAKLSSRSSSVAPQ
jgi:hypothetical protein